MIKTKTTKGAAMLVFVLFFAFATSSMMFILGKSIFADLADFNRLSDAKRSYMTAESVTEDIVYRLTYGTFSLDSTESLDLNGLTAYGTSTYDSPNDEYSINSSASAGTVLRKSEAILTISAGSAFNYGLQAGNGGINLSNNSDIFGNVYSNGTVQGAGSAEVHGDIVSAGPTGLIADISATGSVFANTIDNVDVDVDAHYNVDLGGSVIGGTIYTPVTNQPTTTLPISTTTIQEWKDAITTFGTTIASTDPLCSSGTYTLDVSTTIGYLKVECDMDIKKTGLSTIITLDGPIWVEGNLSFTQGPDIRVDPSLGRLSVQFIVDNPADRLTSSKIEIRNSTDFSGSGDNRSYIMLMSLNESAEQAGTEIAIDVGQSAEGDVLVYAGSGLVEIGNSIDLREVTGYQIDVANGASVTYEEGLASLLFTSGPGGAYTLDDWQQDE
jgi:hypothetical protein